VELFWLNKGVVIGCALGVGVLLAPLQSVSGSRAIETAWQLPNVEKEARVQTSHEFNIPVKQVWALISGFNTLPDYHASITASKLKEGGAVRHITLSEAAGGGVVVERLVYFDEEARIFSYRIIDLIDSDLAFRNYQARVHLVETGANSCVLEWGSSFDVEGASIAETEELARVIYQGCYDGIQRVLEEK
jgi:hypothetical protein